MSLKLSDYQYNLPDYRIATFPVEPRDGSKLLVYQQGSISHQRFYNLPELLSSQDLLVFNNTKVIPARLEFFTHTGAHIEIFLLNPLSYNIPVHVEMQKQGSVEWLALIGNKKKWKAGHILERKLGNSVLSAQLIGERDGYYHVQLMWEPDNLVFADIIELCGKVPLPPYIKREVVDKDKHDYQTIFAKHAGAVAAPTASLHFTDEVLSKLKAKGVQSAELTLHVGAGTFKPIKADNPLDHQMHEEQMVVSLQFLKQWLSFGNKAVAVGTTAMRTLESLYWYGVKLMYGETEFLITQHDPYRSYSLELPTLNEAILTIINYMELKNLTEITGYTGIYLYPGYSFKAVAKIITNFHQPGSTLILLVAAFIGEDWRKVYQEALDNNYRFLSYGDSSILVP